VAEHHRVAVAAGSSAVRRRAAWRAPPACSFRGRRAPLGEAARGLLSALRRSAGGVVERDEAGRPEEPSRDATSLPSAPPPASSRKVAWRVLGACGRQDAQAAASTLGVWRRTSSSKASSERRWRRASGVPVGLALHRASSIQGGIVAGRSATSRIPGNRLQPWTRVKDRGARNSISVGLPGACDRHCAGVIRPETPRAGERGSAGPGIQDQAWGIGSAAQGSHERASQLISHPAIQPSSHGRHPWPSGIGHRPMKRMLPDVVADQEDEGVVGAKTGWRGPPGAALIA